EAGLAVPEAQAEDEGPVDHHRPADHPIHLGAPRYTPEILAWQSCMRSATEQDRSRLAELDREIAASRARSRSPRRLLAPPCGAYLRTMVLPMRSPRCAPGLARRRRRRG